MNQLNKLRESATAFWQERDVRERKILAFGALFLLLALVYLLFLNPALSGRTQLDKALPVMRQQAAELQGLAGQAAQLAQAGAPAVAPVTKESINAALARYTLKPQNVLMTGELTKVQFAEASFAQIVGWLDEMQRASRLSVVEATVEALPTLDRVNATLTLRQQNNEERK
jgi:general secretion pathway protein M